MSFFNIGKKDEYGRQTRIEHRGRYLRASRTGGVVLRAQTKAAGVNFTGNSSQGIRVSTTPVKDTQVALQNGRFILRGRYGQGPTKLNLSKTGLTVSTRNKLGTFNWIKPNRSSAKIAGVQVRGRNAVILQSIYFGFAAIGVLLRAVVAGLQVLIRLVVWLANLAQWAIHRTPPALKSLKRTIRNQWLRRHQRRLDPTLLQALHEASDEELQAMVWLILAQWGRGQSVSQAAALNADGDSSLPVERTSMTSRSNDPRETLRANTLLRAVERDATDGDWHLAFLAGIAEHLSHRLESADRAELLLEIDENLLASATRTVLQARMLEVYADFAGLRLQLENEDGASESTEPTGRRGKTTNSQINLNTASVAELQAIPHIGPERAQALVAMRPIRAVEELHEINGLGPSRVDEIRKHGVSL